MTNPTEGGGAVGGGKDGTRGEGTMGTGKDGTGGRGGVGGGTDTGGGGRIEGRTDGDERDEEVPAGLRRFMGGSWRETARYADAAYGLVGGLLGMGLLGWLADRYFRTSPRWLLVGLLVGGGVGFYRLGRAMLSQR